MSLKLKIAKALYRNLSAGTKWKILKISSRILFKSAMLALVVNRKARLKTGVALVGVAAGTYALAKRS